ncbi:UNVERIFIED_CONTAM: hypothetical protein K2H54_001070 [Gekko kuhli]
MAGAGAGAAPSVGAYFAFKREVLLGPSEWLRAPDRHRARLLYGQLCCVDQNYHLRYQVSFGPLGWL